MSAHDQEMQDRRHPVDEDIALQRRIWCFERLGWYALVLVVILAMCGLFSHGWLSTTTVSSPKKDLIVEYERFHRSGSVNTMLIHTQSVAGKTHIVVIGKAILEGFSVDSIQPQPAHSAGTQEGLRLTLPGDDQGTSTLYIAWRSEGLGLYRSEITLEGGSHVSLTQFIYP